MNNLIKDVTEIVKDCEFDPFLSMIEKGNNIKAVKIIGGNSFNRNKMDNITALLNQKFNIYGLAWIGMDVICRWKTIFCYF